MRLFQRCRSQSPKGTLVPPRFLLQWAEKIIAFRQTFSHLKLTKICTEPVKTSATLHQHLAAAYVPFYLWVWWKHTGISSVCYVATVLTESIGFRKLYKTSCACTASGYSGTITMREYHLLQLYQIVFLVIIGGGIILGLICCPTKHYILYPLQFALLKDKHFNTSHLSSRYKLISSVLFWRGFKIKLRFWLEVKYDGPMAKWPDISNV